MKNYVIIGNSAAGIGGVEGIRSVDREGKITVISREAYHTYSRPLISYLLEGKTDKEKMKYRPDSFYEDNDVRFMPGREAVGVDKDKHTVTLSDGETLPYDSLLVASGSRPFVPPMDGLDGVAKKYSFMTLDDALEIEAEINDDSTVLIIGAGLIGMKCAEGILGRVKKIIIIDLADRILPNILDYDGAKMVQCHIEAKGVEFILSDVVDHFTKNSAVLRSGTVIDFDMLILAVGVRPSTELFSDAGCKIEKGVITDDRMQTDVKDIYAAGDCTVSYDVSCGENRILALLPNAYMQGRCAGINMAGGDCVFGGAIPMNATKFMGLQVLTAGSYTGDVYSDCAGGHYKKLFYKDDRLVGFILIGDVARAGIYTSLIREGTPLSTLDFGLICESPQLMAYSAADRKLKININ